MGKDRKKSRREDNDTEREHSKTNEASKEREKEALKDLDNGRRLSSRDRREDIEEHEKRKNRDKVRDKEYDKRDKYREKEREREKDHGREREIEKEHHERGKERKEKERDRERDQETERDRAKDREREKHKDRQREKENERDKNEREKARAKEREKDIETDRDDKERPGDGERERLSRRNRDDIHDRPKNGRKDEKGIQQDEGEQKTEWASSGAQESTSELQERILKMKEERLKKKKPEGDSELLAWVSKSRKIEEKKNAEKEKAMHLSKVFEEQDNIDQGDSDEEGPTQQFRKSLAGVKVLHGLDKVLEGGAVVLTLKDQNILADGDINQEVDMLENIEIGEQKQRDEAYRAAKKKTGIYEDKFSEEAGFQKKMLPQYDDPVEDEGVTLDESGRFTGEAERKLEELRKRIQGVSTSTRFEDLNSSGKLSSDYFTQEEMLQFKKPKKKKSMRKKEKLDLDALEAEAISAGLGMGDLGSRNEAKMQSTKAEQQKSEAQMRSDAYKSAYAKAEVASKALKQEQFSTAQVDQDQTLVFGDDDEDLYKSLEKARRLALRSQEEAKASGPQAVAALAIAATKRSADAETPQVGETQEEKVVFTEMEEFVWGLQNDEEVHSPSISRAHKPDGGDVFNDKDEVLNSSDQEGNDEAGGWTEVKDTNEDEDLGNEMKEEVAPDEIIHEVAVGKGLSGALRLLKDRGTLKETINWGGRNMDKKKSKLVGIYENEGPKESEIRLERLDEFGRVMTPKEAFRNISHKFHGKGPGKMKQEKRMKQYQEELKLKQMKNSDTPSQSMERMREAQALMKTPYLVLSGHVKPGQTSDPRSGFATEDLPGGLTPMLGDRKVEHFLGIKRKADPGSSMGPPKKPKNG